MALVPARAADSARPKGRPPLFDGIFLTHAHMGHVAGLLQLGREAYAAEGQAVYASPSVCAFLEQNAPWKLLVSEAHVVLHPLDGPVELAGNLRVTPIAVPHRAEFSDTHAFRIDGPRASVLYLPDIDAWEEWDHDLAEEVRGVDVALLDGTFAREGELPGRSQEAVPHPRMAHTLELLPPELHGRVLFTHLNHTNTATEHVADEGQVIGL
jgi:pyrroloquinoline quinone biosynthesis protein B